MDQSVYIPCFTRAWGRLGAGGVHGHYAPCGVDDEIHVVHRHGAEQHFVAEHRCADVAEALLERHFERPHVESVFDELLSE